MNPAASKPNGQNLFWKRQEQTSGVSVSVIAFNNHTTSCIARWSPFYAHRRDTDALPTGYRCGDVARLVLFYWVKYDTTVPATPRPPNVASGQGNDQPDTDQKCARYHIHASQCIGRLQQSPRPINKQRKYKIA